MMQPVPIASTIRVINPSRNQAARRRIGSLGWVMPKVRKKAVARASRNRIFRWYAGEGSGDAAVGDAAFG
jgi:gentisate 1,2-dioxygenase